MKVQSVDDFLSVITETFCISDIREDVETVLKVLSNKNFIASVFGEEMTETAEMIIDGVYEIAYEIKLDNAFDEDERRFANLD